MTEEIQAQKEQKNVVATVGMRFSIIGFIALISLIFMWLWFPLLFVWFILWIIGLFYKPRGRARVAVIIPLLVFIAIASLIHYLWSSIKVPAIEFKNWAEAQAEQYDEETFDNDRFSDITEEEFNNIFSSMEQEEFKSLIENSEWSNTVEKASYALFGILQQGLINSLERYNNEISEIESEQQIENNEEVTDTDQPTETNENVENTTVNVETENVEVFSQSEQNDIEQILNILE